MPLELSKEAIDFLANFDMGSIGNSYEDAASECWSELVIKASKAPKILEFQNPVFNSGWNTTVRRGKKWSFEEYATVKIGSGLVTVKIQSLVYRFNQLSDHNLRNEHDPSCKTVEGLLIEMRRVYEGFKSDEEVTVVNFWLPEIAK